MTLCWDPGVQFYFSPRSDSRIIDQNIAAGQYTSTFNSIYKQKYKNRQ